MFVELTNTENKEECAPQPAAAAASLLLAACRHSHSHNHSHSHSRRLCMLTALQVLRFSWSPMPSGRVQRVGRVSVFVMVPHAKAAHTPNP